MNNEDFIADLKLKVDDLRTQADELEQLITDFENGDYAWVKNQTI